MTFTSDDEESDQKIEMENVNQNLDNKINLQIQENNGKL